MTKHYRNSAIIILEMLEISCKNGVKVVPEGPRQVQSHQNLIKITRMASRNAFVPHSWSILREKGCPGRPRGDPQGSRIQRESIQNDIDFQVDFQTSFFHGF